MMLANRQHGEDISQLWCQYYQWEPGNCKQLYLDSQNVINVIDVRFGYFGYLWDFRFGKIQLSQAFLN